MEELRKELEAEIEQGDSYMCSRVAGEMLKLLEPRAALQIALNQFSKHRSAFEKIHPEENWVQRWFELTSKFEPIDYAVDGVFGFWDSPVSDFEAKAYIYGLSLLDSAFRAYFHHRSDVVFNLSGEALDCLANARMGTYLREEAPTMMSQYDEVLKIDNELWTEEQSRILMAFRHSADRRQFIRIFWTGIADEIAAKMAH